MLAAVFQYIEAAEGVQITRRWRPHDVRRVAGGLVHQITEDLAVAQQSERMSDLVGGNVFDEVSGQVRAIPVRAHLDVLAPDESTVDLLQSDARSAMNPPSPLTRTGPS